MSYHYGITAYLEPNSEPIIGSSLCIDRDDTWNKQHATRAGKKWCLWKGRKLPYPYVTFLTVYEGEFEKKGKQICTYWKMYGGRWEKVANSFEHSVYDLLGNRTVYKPHI